MNSENIGTTKRRKQMMLNNKTKDESIYYYGPESKYISNKQDGKCLFVNAFTKIHRERKGSRE